MDHYRASLITVITIRCCCMRSFAYSLVFFFAGERTERSASAQNEAPRHDFEPTNTNIHNGKRIEYKSDNVTTETMNFRS